MLHLLSDPTVAAILSACAEREQTNKDLEERTGAKSTPVKYKLELLEAYGLLRRGPLHQRQGRPAASWRAASTTELAAFERRADAFAKALARSVEQMVDESSATSQLRVVDDRS